MNKKIKLNSENIIITLVFLALFIYPLHASGYGVLNWSYFIGMTILTLSISLLWGLGGIFNFGVAAFFGIGAYTYAIVSLNFETAAITPVALICALIVTGVFAWVLGYLIFYGGITDVFVGLITLCVAISLETFMGQTAGPEWKIGSVLLGGFNGINEIPSITLGTFAFQGTSFYFLSLILLLALYIGLRMMLKKRWGYTLIALRENRERTKLFGYNVPRIETIVFTASSMIAALSGVLYVSWGNYVVPSALGMAASVIPIIIVASAGRKNLSAGLIFTLIYYYYSQKLSSSGSEYGLVILGASLILIVLFIPQGIIAACFEWLDRLFQRKDKSKIEMRSVNEESSSNF